MKAAMTDLEQRDRDGFRFQAGFAEMMASPIVRRICLAVAEALNGDSRTGRALLAWPGEPIRDAMPLRLVGGLHALALAGNAELGELFAGGGDDPRGIVQRALVAHDDYLLPWLDGPPQTNEAARSAALMVGLLEVAKRHGPKLELLEIGSSAGLNLLIDRYRFELGGVSGRASGCASRRSRRNGVGRRRADVPVEIVSVRGVDIAPIDLDDSAQVERLRAYVWADAPERLERMTAAIAMRPPVVEQGDAADWVEARLAEPQAAGVTRVLMHSVVWQYLPDATAARIDRAMAGGWCGGDRGTPARLGDDGTQSQHGYPQHRGQKLARVCRGTGVGDQPSAYGADRSGGLAAAVDQIVVAAILVALLIPFGLLALARFLLAHLAAVVAVGFFLAGRRPVDDLARRLYRQGDDVERGLGDAAARERAAAPATQ